MKFVKNVSLANFTTIGIGGVAEYFCEPKEEEELRRALFFALERDKPIFPLGRGANTLFGDFRGLVISMRRLRKLSVRERDGKLFVSAQAGVPLNELVALALKENLEGIYRLAGFPATVGGAIAMNAGAFGYEISQNLVCLSFMDYEGKVHRLKKEEIAFSYRFSPFPQMGLVLEAEFEFKRARADIKTEYEAIRKKRKESQPVNMPTCGSTFKNPPGYHAGKLLEEVKLKGYRIGDIAFSEKHANFLVNLGRATYEQALKIIQEAKRRVYESFGVELEEEVRLVEGCGFNGWKVCGKGDIPKERSGGPFRPA